MTYDFIETSPFRVRLEALLEPISEENPAGESLRYSSEFDEIKAARKEDDARLEQGIWQTALKKADWLAVDRIAIGVLRTRTKDLQVGAWLTESWLKQYGLAGFREGLRLERALCERFWDTLHPLPEGGDMEYRVAPVEWINEQLSNELRLLPVTQPEGDDSAPYSLFSWEMSSRPEPPAPKKGTPATDSKRVTPALFERSAIHTPTRFLQQVSADAASALEHCRSLDAFLTERCGPEAPSLRLIMISLEGILSLANNLLSQRRVEEPAPEPPVEVAAPSPAPWFALVTAPPTEVSMSEPVAPPAGVEVAMPTRWTIRDRAEAYRLLAEAAEYLVRTEPHSPTPYLVRRAISWGNMPLPQLLPQLVKSSSELTEIAQLLQLGEKEG